MVKSAIVGIGLLASLTVGGSDTPDEFIAVVARRISTQASPLEPGDFNHEFKARYRVLHVVFGSYPEREIEFLVYDHYGVPYFFKYDTVLLYVSRYGHQWIHEKYQFQDVYKTSDGRWASCGDPYRYEPSVHRGPIQAVPLVFTPELSFSIANLAEEQIAKEYPSAYYERRNGEVICRAGAYVEQLFTIKRDGVLRARGLFK